MKILVLGGTVFLGRYIVQQAINRGHDVTVFNRGNHLVEFAQTAPIVVPVRRLIGNRDSDVRAIERFGCDAVIDCSGYTPEHLAQSISALADSSRHYLFISTISVYAQFPPSLGYDEAAALTSETTGYGGQKARAEELLLQRLGDRATIVRPGLIVGPHDLSGRFAYWPLRLHRGGTILCPGRPQRNIQFIDVRDLAAWCINLVERHTLGVFQAVGASGTMAQMLEDCISANFTQPLDVAHEAHRPRPSLVWRDDAQLLAAGVAPWVGLPLWIPESDPDFGGMLMGSNARAIAADLKSRSWVETARDTLQWALSCPNPPVFPNVLSAEDEAMALR